MGGFGVGVAVEGIEEDALPGEKLAGGVEAEAVFGSCEGLIREGRILEGQGVEDADEIEAGGGGFGVAGEEDAVVFDGEFGLAGGFVAGGEAGAGVEVVRSGEDAAAEGVGLEVAGGGKLGVGRELDLAVHAALDGGGPGRCGGGVTGG